MPVTTRFVGRYIVLKDLRGLLEKEFNKAYTLKVRLVTLPSCVIAAELLSADGGYSIGCGRLHRSYCIKDAYRGAAIIILECSKALRKLTQCL